MNAEIFETRREFNKKFTSGLYQCCFCAQLTPNPYVCAFCFKQANQMFNDRTYKFIIKEEFREVQQIFKPIELQK